MSVHTILFDFTVNPKDVVQSQLLESVEDVFRDYLKNFRLLNSTEIDSGIFHSYACDNASIINLRIFKNGLITVTIEYYKEEGQEPLLTYEKCKEVELYIKQHVLGIVSSSSNVPIKRGVTYSYYPTSDERLIEYDIDELVFEKRTPFQKVQIVHSKSLGNMLVLDDLQNISEADLIYTETIMARGKECYKGKEIVILGGGDGGLLYELLKENPKHVLMLEIDEIVMQACAKHMRSVCGDVLDKYTGPNYEVIVGDCMKSLNQFIKEGRKFDYVFGDLTDIPINDLPTSEIWEFIRKVLGVAFKVLKPDGKYMTHGNGANCEESLKKYEALLEQLDPSVIVTKSKAFIPSFMEDWVFYQIGFANKV